ncbi:dihydrofolate reductase family protein [Knoellia subterranea]|uniref:Riboflavin biosynthesis protein RibD n=1 Tax=Knoellia subterranea KCTC 19937 TaxID=1385521 RepID=A0A0A0JJL2_9MICO|nr:dihydrofolate reductase family protein [Knoellia subterranea]KGN36242.1 riboflavin biosynthesis protein RibD [Knoellia subterranea KCTC 19937]
MQSVMIDLIISLDGYAAADGWPGLWGVESPEYLDWLGAQDTDYTVLLGAKTYRLMSDFAAQMPDDPGFVQMAEMPKVVFSSTLDEPLSWANSVLVREDPVAWVREQKESGPRPMRTLGSLSVCRSLLVAGLVDRFRVVVFPFITGARGQERIFDGYPDIGLELVESKTFDKGMQLLEYVPTVLDGPPAGGLGSMPESQPDGGR